MDHNKKITKPLYKQQKTRKETATNRYLRRVAHQIAHYIMHRQEELRQNEMERNKDLGYSSSTD